jgi:Calcineurin-like phosphoesterase
VQRTAILGDIHGDYERMLEHVGGLDTATPLVVVGDYFDRWDQGLEAIRWLMARPNTTCILGNHDVLMLAVLEEVERGQEGRAVESWVWNGGKREDMVRLQHDPEAIDWIRSLPAMAMLDDILVQHCDAPVYLNYGGSVGEVNSAIRRRIDSRDPDVLFTVFAHLCRRRQFYNPGTLREYLSAFGARALVHGHTPHTQPGPISLFNGAITNVDGAMSRGFGPEPRGFVYWVGDEDRAMAPAKAAEGA